MENKETKRFEDWNTVECSECARYWDSSCDGVTGSQKPCNSFLATRSILIPEKLNRLQKSVKWLTASLLCTDFAILIHFLIHLLGGYGGYNG